ncbi:long-subunit acyl-CoA synthetase (AMP-forming) [Pontibacter aydingkolensis]|uniref:DUF2752 domain-containing protein n=1 Tax=Pontibacter aydingkolensis TaxID=1911536 RepID=A0ABS7CPX1_9BACT|nr:DUF2752 domain-containing protein [Pontibacter aydingkolensis]MBW7465818.1 DUF2752 domain-containing protein [Pontibacter aydingkolensis]
MKLNRYTAKFSYLAEAGLWLTGLTLLALMNPEGEHLFSFCPYSWILESGCIGCGIGHGISFLLKGNLQASWEAHSLAAPALLVLLWRCWQLLRWHFRHFNLLTLNKHHG